MNAAYNLEPWRFNGASFVDPEKMNVLVLGDSFARDFINAGLENGYFAQSELSYYGSQPFCLAGAEDLEDGLRERIKQADYVVIGLKEFIGSCWKTDFAIFQQLGAKNFIVLGPKNFGWNMNAMMRLPVEGRPSYRVSVLKDVLDRDAELKEMIPASMYVSILEMISDAPGQVPVFTEDGKVISQDRIHLTKAGARFVGKKIFEHPLLAPLRQSRSMGV